MVASGGAEGHDANGNGHEMHAVESSSHGGMASGNPSQQHNHKQEERKQCHDEGRHLAAYNRKPRSTG